MNEKIVIPSGMLEAARQAWMVCGDYPCTPERFRLTVVPSIEAAITWLNASIKYMRGSSVESCDKDFIAGLEAVRKLFLAPQNPTVVKVHEVLQGSTLTGEEAKAIIDRVRMCTRRIDYDNTFRGL